MTIAIFLQQAIKQLEQSDIATARLDCIVLLEDLLDRDRSQLLAHLDDDLTEAQHKTLASWIARRAKHEPLAYIRHKTEFYGREFYINHSVLEPRPESEAMIDLLKELPAQEKLTIADIGTGSGTLAITAKLELPQATVVAVDIDPACLRVAARNAATLHTPVQLLQGNLLEPLLQRGILPSVCMCNLPYVPDNFAINPAAMREPRRAIFGGPDGLDVYRTLFSQLMRLPRAHTFTVLTEALPPQHAAIEQLAAASGCTLMDKRDFVQVFRRGSAA